MRSSLVALATVVAASAVAPPADAGDLYLNFPEQPITLSSGPVDDAAQDTTSLPITGTIGPFDPTKFDGIRRGAPPGPAVSDEIASELALFLAPYDIAITTERPARAPYIMAVVASAPSDFGLSDGFDGLARVDCDDRVASDVIIVFAAAEALGTTRDVARAIAHEVGHAYGLEHSANEADLMFPSVRPEQMSFLDMETPIVDGSICGRTSENSHRLLLARAGPAGELPFGSGSCTFGHLRSGIAGNDIVFLCIAIGGAAAAARRQRCRHSARHSAPGPLLHQLPRA